MSLASHYFAQSHKTSWKKSIFEKNKIMPQAGFEPTSSWLLEWSLSEFCHKDSCFPRVKIRIYKNVQWSASFNFCHQVTTVLLHCGNCLQLFGFWNFFVFFRFFPSKLVYFWTKSRKKYIWVFFHSFCATDLNFGSKNNGRMKYIINSKALIFTSYWGPEVVWSSCYQKMLLRNLLHCVRRLSWSTTYVATLAFREPNLKFLKQPQFH